jgi:hypothetical protein
MNKDSFCGNKPFARLPALPYNLRAGRLCSGVNLDGSPCRRLAKSGSTHCPGHESRLTPSKRKGGYRDPYKKFDTVDEYFRSLKTPHRNLGNNWDLLKIAKACGLTIAEVRGSLQKLGYVKTENKHGLIRWRLNQ